MLRISKKSLRLGGSAQQVVAIEKAKELGYYTVLCDFLSDNPGQYVADKFYLESTTDKDTILKSDGILAYTSAFDKLLKIFIVFWQICCQC